MKKILTLGLLTCMLLVSNAAIAKETHGKNNKVTPKSIGAGALSFLIWPGIGQLMNDEKNTDKAASHAIIGLFPPFRIWSGYDAVVNRKGGVWDNRI